MMKNKTSPLSEEDFYKSSLGYDPYAIWITKLKGLNVVKIPARLMAYSNDDHSRAYIRYLDGTTKIVNSEQMSGRHPKSILELH